MSVFVSVLSRMESPAAICRADWRKRQTLAVNTRTVPTSTAQTAPKIHSTKTALSFLIACPHRRKSRGVYRTSRRRNSKSPAPVESKTHSAVPPSIIQTEPSCKNATLKHWP